MRIYTSYFGVINKVKAKYHGKVGLIDIARFGDKYGQCDFRFADIAPSEKLLRDYKSKSIGEKQYSVRYMEEVLECLDAKKVELAFRSMCDALGVEDLVLFCYEKPNEFCHRHLFAHWFNENTEYNIAELKID